MRNDYKVKEILDDLMDDYICLDLLAKTFIHDYLRDKLPNKLQPKINRSLAELKLFNVLSLHDGKSRAQIVNEILTALEIEK